MFEEESKLSYELAGLTPSSCMNNEEAMARTCSLSLWLNPSSQASIPVLNQVVHPSEK